MSQQQYEQTKALQERYEWEQSQLPPQERDDYVNRCIDELKQAKDMKHESL